MCRNQKVCICRREIGCHCGRPSSGYEGRVALGNWFLVPKCITAFVMMSEEVSNIYPNKLCK